MKNLILAISGILLSASVLASDDYPKNPILRPLTMNDGGWQASVAVGHASKVDGDDDAYVAPAIRYGITDNLTVGVGGITYRVYNNDGLEVAVNGGFRGFYDSKEFGDSVGYGAAVVGKQVINDSFAITFGFDYVNWDEEKIKDRSEMDYSIGAMFNLAPDWTVSAGYTYRDLEDFSQDHANVYNVALSYAYNDDIDVGLYAAKSDFKEVINGHYLHDEFEKTAGVFVNWRF